MSHVVHSKTRCKAEVVVVEVVVVVVGDETLARGRAVVVIVEETAALELGGGSIMEAPPPNHEGIQEEGTHKEDWILLLLLLLLGVAPIPGAVAAAGVGNGSMAEPEGGVIHVVVVHGSVVARVEHEAILEEGPVADRIPPLLLFLHTPRGRIMIRGPNVRPRRVVVLVVVRSNVDMRLVWVLEGGTSS